MGRQDWTNMGGADASFHTTRWTQIFAARTDDRLARAAMNELCGRYWRPVYCYLRHKGFGSEQAKDLTQGFFDEVVLGRRLIHRADRQKGRFRTFLLAALNNHVVSAHRAQAARKRRPKEALLRLDGLESPALPEPATDGTPDKAFHYAWASALLDEVLKDVRDGCLRGGQQTHWQVFSAVVVRPILEETEAPSLKDLCRLLGVADASKASNMIVTVKRRFQTTLKQHVRRFVRSDAEVDEEIRDLMAALSGGAG